MPVETFDSGPADVGLAGDRYDKLKAHFKVRYGYLQEMRRPFEIMWQQVDDSILPYRYSVSNEAEQFNDITINKKIFDGETINASMTAANSFVAAVAPQGVPYFQTEKSSTKISTLPQIVNGIASTTNPFLSTPLKIPTGTKNLFRSSRKVLTTELLQCTPLMTKMGIQCIVHLAKKASTLMKVHTDRSILFGESFGCRTAIS